MTRIYSYLREQFSLDLRYLALMRIGIAVILIFDLSIRLSDLSAHYSEQGILPLHALFSKLWNEWLFSFHAISKGKGITLILFLIHIFAAFSLLIGYKTKLSTFICWILLVSVHNRNPLILQGGDDLLRMTLFWCMFIPWGARYSIDCKNVQSGDHKIQSFAGFCLIMQIAAVYYFSALLKTSPEWRSDNTALYFALSLDQMVLPLGKIIYPFESLLKVFTWIVFRLELIIPFFLLIPFENKAFRNTAAILFILFHLGIGLTLFVGLFFLIGIVTSMGILNTAFPRKLDEKLRQGIEKIRMLFPGNIHTQEVQKAAVLSITPALPVILLYILIWNIDVSYKDLKLIPNDLKGPGYTMRINQNWGMFAPSVFKDDGWYVLEGETMKGELIDLNKFGKKLSSAKPSSVVTLFRNDRWRKFSENYLFVSNAWVRPYYCEYLYRSWNNNHPHRKIKSLKIVYMKEPSLPGYKAAIPTREVLSEIHQ